MLLNGLSRAPPHHATPRIRPSDQPAFNSRGRCDKPRRPSSGVGKSVTTNKHCLTAADGCGVSAQLQVAVRQKPQDTPLLGIYDHVLRNWYRKLKCPIQFRRRQYWRPDKYQVNDGSILTAEHRRTRLNYDRLAAGLPGFNFSVPCLAANLWILRPLTVFCPTPAVVYMQLDAYWVCHPKHQLLRFCSTRNWRTAAVRAKRQQKYKRFTVTYLLLPQGLSIESS